MKGTQSINTELSSVNVVHDKQRQIMEIPSLIRVINNYYYKKIEIQKQIKPFLLQKFKEGLKLLESDHDWLHSIPSALDALNKDFTTKKDSFKFPDGIILFEAWMDLGFKALYPKLVLHYQFPGILKGEKTRNLFQFIFSTSRGFGFPIYFNPDFYHFDFKSKKLVEFFFRWVNSICHRANQAIFLVSNKFSIKRHHPGEFESIIISEYKNNTFKGIDTLLHGFFTQDPKDLGKFESLQEVLRKISFSYSIGDHAMNIDTSSSLSSKPVSLLNDEAIKKRYNIDFYRYIKKLMRFRTSLSKALSKVQNKKRKLIKALSLKNKLIFYLNTNLKQTFHLKHNKDNEFYQLSKIDFLIEVLRGLLKMIWTTPLYTHTIHKPIKKEIKYMGFLTNYKEETIDSIFHLYISHLENKRGYDFEENEVVDWIDQLRDEMARIWLYFKERQLNFALRNLNEISMITNNENYVEIINNKVNELIPIFSIYEILHRPLSESVYPETSPQSRKLVAYIAHFLTSRYNPLGVNLMKLFNKLAFQNWSFLILKRKFNLRNFFDFILNLTIWKHIPDDLKKKLISR